MSHRIREQFERARRGGWSRLCSVFRCESVTTRLDGLCYRHKGLRVRNGHETQRAIGLSRIRFYADKAAGFITEADINTMNAALEGVKRAAEDFIATHTDPQHRSRNASGQPYTRRERVEYAARQELAESLGNLRDVQMATKLTVGLTVMQEIEPSLIASDDAFLHQIARAVRRAGRPLRRGSRSPVPTRAGVMVEAGRRIYEAVAMVALRLAREVRLKDEREHAERMRQRDEDEAAAQKRQQPQPQPQRAVIDPVARTGAIVAGLDAWLAQQPCRQQLAVMVATAQMYGLTHIEAVAWAESKGA